MREIVQRIVQRYDNLIQELEDLDREHRDYLQQANGHFPENAVRERMILARDNHRRLQTALAEKEHLVENYLRG